MKTLILADGGVILAVASTVTDMDDRYDTGDGQYPKTIAVATVEVDALPDRFDARYCTWSGNEVVCAPPETVRSRSDILAELAATDSEWQPRWLEDIFDGTEHPSFLSWKQKRADLRAELAGVTN